VTKRALLIGSQTFGLTGANPDVRLMIETLEGRGFECDVHVDDAASRQGILDGYERLIEETQEGSDDPVVIYYSGHGSRTPLADWEERQRRGQRSHLRYLVPYDMEESTDTDFRGLLAEELSALQQRLTARTANVTTILDCCHSGTMSRDPSARPKSVSREFSIEAAMPLLQAADAAAGSATRLDDSNPLAVRLVACDPQQSAYERESSLGGSHGALTEALVVLLRELGDRQLTWRVVADRLRRSITTTLPMQRPEVEGPADRLIFSLATRAAAGALPATVRDGVARIDSARLFGISVGDAYDLRAEDEVPLGTGAVTAIENDHAIVPIGRPDRTRSLPETALAVPTRTTRTRPVSVEIASQAVSEVVRERLGRSTLLRVAAGGEAALARVVGRDGLVVLDAEGFAVQPTPFAADASGAQQAVALAERIARSERIRSLASSANAGGLAGQIGVELATHGTDGRRTRARSGERLHVGERITVTVINRSGGDVHVGLLDVDTAYNVKAINADEPGGWRLASGETKVVGGESGVPLVWDDGVPADAERPESLIVIASTKPVDFRLLETPRGTRDPAPQSELDSLLEEARTGQRGWAPVSGDAGYWVEAVDFYLVPGAKPSVVEPDVAD
jgi:hypothetical protein